MAKRLDGSRRNFVLDGDPAPPPPKEHSPPNFRPISVADKWLHGSRHHLVIWYGARPRPRRLCVKWGPAPRSPKGAEPTNFWPMFIASVVTMAGICNSVGGGVLFNIPLRWRWRISVQYAPCIAGEGRSSVPFPSPHASSCRTRQLPPSLLII